MNLAKELPDVVYFLAGEIIFAHLPVHIENSEA